MEANEGASSVLNPVRWSIAGDEEVTLEPTPVVHTGVFVFEKDGSRYEGDFVEIDGRRLRHGNGRWSLGPEECEGEWQEDLMHGEGKIRFASGAVYEVQTTLMSLPTLVAG